VKARQPNPSNPVFLRRKKRIELLDKEEISRFGRLLLLSLTGYLAAAMFLSRAFVLTLFLLENGRVSSRWRGERGMIAPVYR